jgi:hypothetical protein
MAPGILSHADNKRDIFLMEKSFPFRTEILSRRAEMLARFGHAAHRFARSGFHATPPEILAARESTCRSCPEWDAAALGGSGRCRKCGCSTWAKLRMAPEACPLGKWTAVPPSDSPS